MDNNNKKTAFIAIVGRANVGKSTMLNSLLNEKVSIVSKKPQTTRNRITGILTRDKTQYVFFDTPGIHLPKSLLGRYMTKSANSAIGDVDVVVLMVEPIPKIGQIERGVLDKAKTGDIPLILLINKIDTVSKDKILEIIDVYSKEYNLSVIIPISAVNNDGTELVLAEINKYLVESEFFFPEDMLTDQPEKQIASEIIREKALRLLEDEIPHGVGVSIEEFREQTRNIVIRAEIYCEKESHKKIIIGKNGDMIKKIGSYARQDLEIFFETKIFIDLWVKVKENWRDKQSVLVNLGYDMSDL